MPPTRPSRSSGSSEISPALHLADTALYSWEDVEDPAGGDLPIFRSCAHEISDLIDRLVPELEVNVTPDEEIASGGQVPIRTRPAPPSSRTGDK